MRSEKYHDHHASKSMKELQSGAKVRVQLDTDSKQWKAATVITHHHASRSYVVRPEDGRNCRRNRQHLQVCPAPGRGKNPKPLLWSRANLTVTQDKPDQVAAPAVLPDLLPQEQQPQPPKESSGTPYVTRSGRRIV